MSDHPFKDLISAADMELFCQQDFEIRPKRFSSTPVGNATFGLRDFYTLLRDTLWNENTLHLVPNGEHRTSPELRSKMLLEDGQFTLDRIRATRQAKATIVVNGINRMHQGLRDLIGQINASGLFQAKANAYFTPANAQGFLPHWDRHDVFVLQISGTKEWHIATTPDIENPLELPEYSVTEGYQLGDKTTLTLRAGELLYIPRGFGHYAKALAQDSLHITIGTHAIYWSDVVSLAVEKLIADTPALRRSVALPNQPANEIILNEVKTYLARMEPESQIEALMTSRAKKAAIAQGQVFGSELTGLLSDRNDTDK